MPDCALHGKEGVVGSSPTEGSGGSPLVGGGFGTRGGSVVSAGCPGWNLFGNQSAGKPLSRLMASATGAAVGSTRPDEALNPLRGQEEPCSRSGIDGRDEQGVWNEQSGRQ